MKKVLISTTVSGFVPQFEMRNVRTLQKMGYEIHYASNFYNVSYGTDNSRLEGTGIIQHQIDFARSPFQWKEHKKAYHQLKQLMEQHSFSLIHCHTPVGSVLTRLAAKPYRKKGTKVIYTAHGFHFYKGAPFIYWLLFYPVERLLAKDTDVLITMNEEDFQRASRFCKKKKTKVEYIFGVGIDVAYWSGKDLETKERIKIRKRMRDMLHVPEDTTMILSVGELIPRKNHESVIKSLAKEKQKGNHAFVYVICGHGVLQEQLLCLTKQCGLSDNVIFLGYRQDIRELLYASDLFIFPSKQEGMPVALMEAIAAGVPAKASNIRGNRELLKLQEEKKENADVLECLDIHNIEKKMKEIYQRTLNDDNSTSNSF